MRVQSFHQAMQWYRRLTRVPVSERTRRRWLTARENARSALPLLREGLRDAGAYLHIMEQLERCDHGVEPQDIPTGPYTAHSFQVLLSRLYDESRRAELPLLTREAWPSPNGGRCFRYTLSPLGRAVMAAKELDR